MYVNCYDEANKSTTFKSPNNCSLAIDPRVGACVPDLLTNVRNILALDSDRARL